MIPPKAWTDAVAGPVPAVVWERSSWAAKQALRRRRRDEVLFAAFAHHNAYHGRQRAPHKGGDMALECFCPYTRRDLP